MNRMLYLAVLTALTAVAYAPVSTALSADNPLLRCTYEIPGSPTCQVRVIPEGCHGLEERPMCFKYED